MKQLFVICLLNLFVIQSFAQIEDYRAVRDSVYSVTCGQRTRGQVREALLNLEGLNVDSNTKGMESYHYDLSMCYYLLSINDNFNRDGLETSIRHAKKAAEYSPKYASSAYWSIAFTYAYLEDCENSVKYFKLYKKHTPRKYLKGNKEQIKLLKEKCSK